MGIYSAVRAAVSYPIILCSALLTSPKSQKSKLKKKPGRSPNYVPRVPFGLQLAATRVSFFNFIKVKSEYVVKA